MGRDTFFWLVKRWNPQTDPGASPWEIPRERARPHDPADASRARRRGDRV